MAATFDPSNPKPRRMRTAYAFFVEEHFRRVREFENSPKPQPIMSRLGQMWRGMTDQERKIYFELEQGDRVRYQEEKFEWTQGHKGKPIGYLNRRRNEPNIPKRPQSAYSCFRTKMGDELRGEMPTVTARARDKEIIRRWRALSPKSRNEFKRLAAEDKVRYTKEITVFRDKERKTFFAKQQERLLQLEAQAFAQQRPQPQPQGQPVLEI